MVSLYRFHIVSVIKKVSLYRFCIVSVIKKLKKNDFVFWQVLKVTVPINKDEACSVLQEKVWPIVKPEWTSKEIVAEV